MVPLTSIVEFLDRELELGRVKDDEANGLLVKGSDEVRRVGLATNATFEVIDDAVRKGVNLLLTHHGGWKSLDLDLADVKADFLTRNDCSLYVAHGCLDISEKYGTSHTLARMLGVDVRGTFAEYAGGKAGVFGEVTRQPFDDFLKTVDRIPGARNFGLRNHQDPVGRVAIVTGSGYKTTWLEEAHSFVCDTYLTGEGSMFTTIYARERRINLILAGHTATERPAVLNLGKTIASTFPQAEVVVLPEVYF